MKVDTIMVRFGEYTTKGRNRGFFEKRIYDQVRRVLRPFAAVQMTRTYGRIYIKLNGESYELISAKLKHIFGIASFSPASKCESELEVIRETALEVMHSLPKKPSTFKVTMRRVDKSFPHDSQEMNHLVGSHVLRAMPDLKVDVKNPEVELRVEIQPEGTYVFCEVVPAAGGYPYGTNGKAVLLLSGGIDSPVAGYLAMRKGLELEAIHYHSFPFTSEKAKQKVITLAQKLADMSGVPFKLHMVSFTEIQTAFTQCNQDHLIITLMRRAMLRIAERLAEQAGALGIVTGDSLGQVASQTLGSMNVIGRTVELPLLRPLITTDKNEIIRIAEQIKTYATSILPYEDCCTLFVPKSPSTNPNLNVVLKVESFVPKLDEMIDEAVAGVETLVIKPGESSAGKTSAGSDDWF
ncbi:tRNA uracil 4-sulfurtransferase ThiI [Paenibacillus spongiae]|uniref:Probable tRNA sulfurtransferase n=1 Tax=Paenibacillus spongiae TaxID=2909671 RepID=A0ABY5SEF9_9BACL|nr:tRNA uracil 4-sulfurtransferase ThiI [Paenibacillus spongiae]UVI32164.1 tRNA 4-thiouridine(8) synthase ThiI [Paenibacillus spongiae]